MIASIKSPWLRRPAIIAWVIIAGPICLFLQMLLAADEFVRDAWGDVKSLW